MKPKHGKLSPESLGGKLLSQFGEGPQTARGLVERVDPEGKHEWRKWSDAFQNLRRSELIEDAKLPANPITQAKLYVVSAKGKWKLKTWEEKAKNPSSYGPLEHRESQRLYRLNMQFIVPILALASELGGDRDQIQRNAEKAGVEVRLSRYAGIRWMSCVTEEGAEIIREVYKEKQREVPAGYLNSEQAAAELKISGRTFRKLKKGVVRRVMVGPSYYYHPADIRAWKEREKGRFGIPASPPRGGVGARELVALLNVPQVENLKKWRINGCPGYLLSTGTYYYKLPEVLEWLETRKDYRMKRYARKLKAYLEAGTGGTRGLQFRSTGTGGI